MILAIKGHKTRGEEVINLLKMLGGVNSYNYSADCDILCFYICKGTNAICRNWVKNCYEGMTVFTLEEFLEKYPYKVGDKVRVAEYESEVCIIYAHWDGYG